MSWKKSNNREDTIHYPLKAVQYKGTYAILDDRQVLIATDLSKAAAEEFVGLHEVLTDALAHLNQVVSIQNTSNLNSEDIIAVFKRAKTFLTDIGGLVEQKLKIVDFTDIKDIRELQDPREL